MKRLAPRSPRIGLDLALTARCPLRCRFCTVAKSSAEGLSGERWRALIGEFALHRKIAAISLAGGEPLLHPDLPSILELSLALAEEVKLVTSGVLAFENLPLALCRHPRFKLEVSVDGPQDVHDRLRDGSFSAAWAFVAEALRQTVRLRLRTVVSVFNIDRIEDWLAAVDRGLPAAGRPVGFRFDTLVAPEALSGKGGADRRPGFRRYASRGLLPPAADVAALYERLKGRRFRRLRFEQTEAFRGCGIGRRPAVAVDPAGRFSFCCEAPQSCGSLMQTTVAECLDRLDREMAALACRTCAHLAAGRCDGCWTGQKCGMVGHWGRADCRDLIENPLEPRHGGTAKGSRREAAPSSADPARGSKGKGCCGRISGAVDFRAGSQ